MENSNNQDARPIPPLPGGGSWRFDDEQREWVSNDPAPTVAPADAGNDPAELSATDPE